MRPRLDRIRDPKRSENCLERRLPTIEARAHDRDLLGRRARGDQSEQLLPDQLERTAGSSRFEEADGTVDRRRPGTALGEEEALQMRKCGLGDPVVAGRQLLDAAVRQGRKVVHRPSQRGEDGAAGLVGY